jgi:FKBP-type peptidyl-prolyl cis-trans isomerase FkpA
LSSLVHLAANRTFGAKIRRLFNYPQELTMSQIHSLFRFGLLSLALTFTAQNSFAATKKSAPPAPEAAPVVAAAPVSSIDLNNPKSITELVKTDMVLGKGAEAIDGKKVAIHYTGWIYSLRNPEHKSMQFDSSIGRQPTSFTLGAGKVIKGWDQGVLGMKVGGKRNLVLPAALAYGERGIGRGMVPRNAIVIFEVELMDVKDPEATTTK